MVIFIQDTIGGALQAAIERAVMGGVLPSAT